MKKNLLFFLLKIVLWRVALLWCKTLSITKVNDEQIDELKRGGKNYVVAFWHGSMFVGWFLNRPLKNERVVALVSQSSDGEFLSTILERWKYSMIRGSSHIGGKEAMQLMVDEVAKGSSLAITPDGPRGPRREMKMGALRVAQKTNVPLLLCGIALKKKKQLRSWDKFEVPMPFSNVIIKYSEPIIVPKELENESLDAFRLEIQNRLNLLTEEAEKMFYQKGGQALLWRASVKPHWLLFPFSLLYGFVVLMRNLFFDLGILKSVDVGVPVISIGNITTGGTGKTPIVKNVANIFLDAGKKVAIVSRGYGRQTTGTVIVSDGKNILRDADSAGDEPFLLAQQLKNTIVIVDEHRVRGAKKAIEEFGAEVIILDDGFQHRYIKRTKDIVLIDSQHSPFETVLLPAGYRREMVGSLKRADAVIVTKAKNVDDAAMMLNSDELDSVRHKFSSSFQPSGVKHIFSGIVQSVEILQGHSAIALCGIAKPESFQKSLESCGVNIKEFFDFSDHHKFTTSEIDAIVRSFHSEKADFIFTTEKDTVRLAEFANELKQLPMFALLMDVTIHQHDEWKKYLLSDGTLYES